MITNFFFFFLITILFSFSIIVFNHPYVYVSIFFILHELTLLGEDQEKITIEIPVRLIKDLNKSTTKSLEQTEKLTVVKVGNLKLPVPPPAPISTPSPDAINLPIPIKPTAKEECDSTHSNVQAMCNPPLNAAIQKACTAWYKQCPDYKALTFDFNGRS